MTVAVERKVRVVKFVPKPGEQIFSVNLAMVDVSDLMEISKQLGLKPEVVQVEYRTGQTEIHAMLWQGPVSQAPADLETKYDQLCDLIDADAVRFAIAAQ
jgi:glutamine synthetase